MLDSQAHSGVERRGSMEPSGLFSLAFKCGGAHAGRGL
jgi:hypothetical protein